MASPERKFSTVPPAGPEPPSAMAARLASLEDEATRLRAEIAALQDDIRWLTGADDEAEPGWLARGWVRASLLLATVGVVAIASLPYLLHRDPAGLDAAPAAATAAPAPASRPAPAAPAARAVARKAIPEPARVRETEIPAPARVPATGDRIVPAPRPRLAREGRPAASDDAVVHSAPARHDNSP
jgi:hypothetical protein